MDMRTIAAGLGWVAIAAWLPLAAACRAGDESAALKASRQSSPSAGPLVESGAGEQAARLEQAIAEQTRRFKALIEARRGLLARRDEINRRRGLADQQQAQALAGHRVLARQWRSVQSELALIGSMRTRPIGRFTRSQRAQYNRLSGWMQELVVMSNNLEQAAIKQKIRSQSAQSDRSATQADLRKLAPQSEQLCRQWLSGLDFLRTRSSAEHQALQKYFSELLQQDPENAGALLGRGLAAWRLGQTDKATADFSRAIEIDTGCASSALAAQALLDAESGRPEDAKADFDKAWRLGRNNPRLYLLRGVDAARRNDFGAAARDFKMANNSPDVTSEGYRLLALLHAEWSTSPGDGHASQSLGFARRACTLGGAKDWASLDALAAAYAALGQFGDAAQAAGRAAAAALDDNRQSCLEHQRKYAAHQRPQCVWH